MLVTDYIENQEYLTVIEDENGKPRCYMQTNPFPLPGVEPRPLQETDGRKVVDRLRGKLWSPETQVFALKDIPEGKCCALYRDSATACDEILGLCSWYFDEFGPSLPAEDVQVTRPVSMQEIGFLMDEVHFATLAAQDAIRVHSLMFAICLGASVFAVAWLLKRGRRPQRDTSGS